MKPAGTLAQPASLAQSKIRRLFRRVADAILGSADCVLNLAANLLTLAFGL
jgi:hypothetical protein